MGKIIKFKKRINEIDPFYEQLYSVEQLYINGEIDRIIIVCNGKYGKFATSNGLLVKEGKELCSDFIENAPMYID